MTISELRAIAGSIENPKDYFLGIDPLPSQPPTNVLQFIRRDASHLDPSHGTAVHRRFVMIANLETSGYVILDGSTIPLHEGEGLLVFPFQSHHYARLSREDKACWLFTTFEYSEPKELEPLRDSSFRYEDRDIERLSRLTSLLKDHSDGNSRGAASPFELALLLSGLLQRRRSRLVPSESVRDGKVRDIEFLQATALFIHRNLARPLSAGDIAREAGLSSSRLRSKFRTLTGASLGRYIRETRMQKAKGLLHSTQLNITQIAESCGFESLFSFSRAFRGMTGLSPSQFRRQIANT